MRQICGRENRVGYNSGSPNCHLSIEGYKLESSRGAAMKFFNDSENSDNSDT
ncbi:14733_t:CDS:2 [Gigaspora margarita]|uniref:14733_t:CDS:1 n=1 Tax=Gigaspora margarita TaxID=4874 RepID=A0ABN7UQM4_GIGMA|nr:14733_t:CDS:2 [Gigaspora margarita]